jgi:hypothetical protein
MAAQTNGHTQVRRGKRSAPAPAANGTDDIARGNVGTADQGPGDVYPEDPVTAHTGELPVGEASPPTWPWTRIVKEALVAGRVVVLDPATGHRRAMYAHCPRDGHAAGVRRVVRGPADAVIELTMRCPICGHEFGATPEALFLR